jgi:hypothetical protein
MSYEYPSPIIVSYECLPVYASSGAIEEQRHFRWAPISTSSRDGLLHLLRLHPSCGFIRGVLDVCTAIREIDMAFWLLERFVELYVAKSRPT